MTSKIKIYLVTTACIAVVPAQSFAQDASEASVKGDDIVVTARRIEERLQDVPISISVFTQDELNKRNISNQADLALYTPSLAVNSRFGSEKSSFVIRGFQQEMSTSPSVGVYFADVVAPRGQGITTGGSALLPGTFFDLQNVQVLKGPQGTLFGRNTTGGAVLVVPQKPVDRFEGYVEGSAGNFDMWRAQAVVNVPVSETLRIRVGFDRQQRAGYMRNHATIGPNRYNDVDYWAARLSAVLDVTPELENYFIATYNKSDTTGAGNRLVLCNRSPAAGSTPAVLAPLACGQIDRQAARGDGLLDIENNNPTPSINLRHFSLINTTTWRASDNLTVKNIVSYAEFRERDNLLLYATNFTVPATVPAGFGLSGIVPVGTPFNYINTRNSARSGEDAFAQSTFTEELQLQGNAIDGRLAWQAGAYLEVSKPLGFGGGDSTIGLACTDLQCVSPINRVSGTGVASGFGLIGQTAQKISFNNKGLYAQGTFELMDNLSLTGGVRYTFDRVHAIAERTNVRYGANGLVRDMVCSDSLRFGSLASPLVVTDRSQCHMEFNTKSSKPTWLLSLEFKPDPNVLVYGKWARGYRQGGIAVPNTGLETWGPESLDTYELGTKASFRTDGIQGSINVAGYYNDFRDMQITANLTCRPGVCFGGAAIVNAGKARIYGLEADASLVIAERLKLEAGYSYLNTRLLSFTRPTLPADSPFTDITPSVLVGGELNFAPKNRITVGATYTVPMEEKAGTLSVGANFTHTDSQLASTLGFAPGQSPFARLPATNFLNANLDWRNVMSMPVDLSLFVTNLTNKVYPVGVTNSYGSAGFEAVLVNAPRMWGVRLRYSFGK